MTIPAIFGITIVKRDCPERANLRIMRKETNIKQNDMTKKLLMMAMLLSAFAFAVPASASSRNWAGAAAAPRSMRPAANSRLPVREFSKPTI